MKSPIVKIETRPMASGLPHHVHFVGIRADGSEAILSAWAKTELGVKTRLANLTRLYVQKEGV